jgi:hypothetical protein
MASFTKGGGDNTPFGRKEFLRSVRDVKTDSFTLAASTVPARTIDGVGGQKILQPGTALAKITSGPEIGKVGPYQAGASDGRQTATNLVGLDLTFLPWQLMDRDVEVSVIYEASVVQAWCTELDAAGVEIALSNAAATAMSAAGTSLSTAILFR